MCPKHCIMKYTGNDKAVLRGDSSCSDENLEESTSTSMYSPPEMFPSPTSSDSQLGQSGKRAAPSQSEASGPEKKILKVKFEHNSENPLDQEIEKKKIGNFHHNIQFFMYTVILYGLTYYKNQGKRRPGGGKCNLHSKFVTHTDTVNTRTCTHTHTHVHTRAHTHTHTHYKCTYVRSTCIYTNTHVHMRVPHYQ